MTDHHTDMPNHLLPQPLGSANETRPGTPAMTPTADRRGLTPERLMRLGNLWLAACLALAAWFLVRPLLPAGGPPERVASVSPSAGAASLELTPASLEPARAERVYRYRAIEDLRVGQRVLSDNPDVAAADKLGGATRVDPATWRRVKLYAVERWPDGTLDTIHIDTLQPSEWLELTGVRVGARVPPPLDLQEMGLSEELRAEVVGIAPCPPLQPPLSGTDPGRLVLTTVNHLNSDVWELSATPVRGPPGSAEHQAAETVTLEPTGFHKFYSETRSAWVSTNELQPGEIIRGRSGPLRVTSAQPQPGVHRVYNLTVEGEHVYYVSRLGVLAHNTCPPEDDVTRLFHGISSSSAPSTPKSPSGFSNPKFGQEVHDGFEKALLEQTGTDELDWIIRTKPGQTGVDATYIGDKNLGFKHAELKPRSQNGFITYNGQVNRWQANGDVAPGETSLWFYNEQGVIGQGHITR